MKYVSRLQILALFYGAFHGFLFASGQDSGDTESLLHHKDESVRKMNNLEEVLREIKDSSRIPFRALRVAKEIRALSRDAIDPRVISHRGPETEWVQKTNSHNNCRESLRVCVCCLSTPLTSLLCIPGISLGIISTLSAAGGCLGCVAGVLAYETQEYDDALHCAELQLATKKIHNKQPLDTGSKATLRSCSNAYFMTDRDGNEVYSKLS